MNIAASIIDKFGGINAMARALGHRNASTVQGWKATGFIPARRQSHVLETAQRLGLNVTPSDFFDISSRPELSDQDTAA